MQDYGPEIPPEEIKNGVSKRIGTIGVDVCKDKVLIIDYPGKRLCIIDTVPAAYKTKFADIALDDYGRPMLKMEYGGSTYKVAFDCGSSIFPLIALPKRVSKFSTSPVNDTISISAWGKMVDVAGRPMRDSFTLAGHRFGNIELYQSLDKENDLIVEGCDGVTGNILFWDKVVVIDFKHKKFGILN